jgi:phospholipase/lecithinase/hemolysin|tara:strand:+ start:6758 stop:7984 length:1227 start_codon:yes stop_codon:yes gene_type:complete
MKSKRRRINKITFAVVAVFMLLAAGCGSSAKISETTSQPANDLFPDKPHKKVNNLYVLGDSLSDTGNLFTIIDGLLLNHNIRMQSPPASVGGQKFSNNYLVAEYVAAHYEVSLGNGWKLANLKKDIMKAVEKEAIHKLVPWLTAFNNNGEADKSLFETIKLISSDVGGKAEGNNYAVANSTIIPYEGVVNEFFAQFSLAKQVDLHRSESSEKVASENTLHLVIIGGNDIAIITSMKTTAEQKEEKIQEVALAYIKQINELKEMGAKKILVSTAPQIGNTPAFFQTQLRDQANHLSALLEEGVSTHISKNFLENEVSFVSLSKTLNDELVHWPKNRQNQACVRDITARYFNLPHFVLHRGELAAKYNKGCNQSSLTDGEFVYYDNFHGTDKLYQLVSRHYIDAIDRLMQ